MSLPAEVAAPPARDGAAADRKAGRKSVALKIFFVLRLLLAAVFAALLALAASYSLRLLNL
jgi:hypothetical protein